MKIDEAANYWINNCINSFDKKIISSTSLSLSILLQAEEDKVIKRSWRSQVNVESVNRFIENNQSKVEAEWQREYEQLKQILDFGGKMLYEEMMLILGLRSDLESGLRFVEERPKELFENLDEGLRDVLKVNLTKVKECRVSAQRNTGSLESYLSKHWWWRFDENQV